MNQQLVKKKIVLVITILFSFNTIDAQKKSEIEKLKTIVYTLSADSMLGRSAGGIGEKKSCKYISHYITKIGFKPLNRSLFQDFTFQKDSFITDTATNIIAYLDNKKDSTIIITAHYDHLGFGGSRSKSLVTNKIHNGADDNASGVTVMLSLGEYLVKQQKNKYNYLIIAFSAHEDGLFGSNAFVKAKMIDLNKIKYLINLDMVGRLNNNEPVLKVIKKKDQFDSLLIKQVKGKMKIMISDLNIDETDATVFVKSKVKAMSLTTGTHDDYHKTTDDADKINYEGMYMITEYLKRIISAM